MSIYLILKGDAAVSAITAEVHTSQAPQGTPAPYIVLDYTSIDPQNNVNGSPVVDNQRVGVDCYGLTQVQSVELYKACRNALDADTHVLTVNIYGEMESDGDVYRTQFDVSEWAQR